MLEAQFRAYIDACTRHDWPTVRGYLRDDLLVNDVPRTAEDFLDDLRALARQHPATRWTIVSCRCTETVVTASLLFENGERYGVEHAHYWTDGAVITEIRIA